MKFGTTNKVVKTRDNSNLHDLDPEAVTEKAGVNKSPVYSNF